MSPDPYAPQGPPRTPVSEVRSPLQQFLARLTDLGATPDELQAVTDHWDNLDPDDSPDPDAFTAARRAELMGKPDQVLTDLLEAGRAEYEMGTTTEAEADEREWTAQYDAALAEAAGRIGGNVEAVLAWVGDDEHRARAVVNLESAPEGAGRKTLLGPLEAHAIDLAADTLTVPAQSLPAAEVGDTVGVRAGDRVAYATVLRYDQDDDQLVLEWNEAQDTPEGHPPPLEQAAAVAAPGFPVLDDGTVVPPAATEAHSGAQGPQPEVT